MKFAFNSDKIMMSAQEVLDLGITSGQFICPECHESVVLRRRVNTKPYFAHVHVNPNCSLSKKGKPFWSDDNYKGLNQQIRPTVNNIEQLSQVDPDLVYRYGIDHIDETRNALGLNFSDTCFAYAAKYGHTGAANILYERSCSITANKALSLLTMVYSVIPNEIITDELIIRHIDILVDLGRITEAETILRNHIRGWNEKQYDSFIEKVKQERPKRSYHNKKKKPKIKDPLYQLLENVRK